MAGKREIQVKIMKFGAVIVTYNRIDQLKKSIKCYTEQTLKPDRIIVVDNCSSDGTDKFLLKWQSIDEDLIKEVIRLPLNEGGSGGFYAGLESMQKHDDIDWIWVADDDAYPANDSFEKARDFITDHLSEIDDISSVCGVCGTNGVWSYTQRHILKKSIFGEQDFPIPKRRFNEDFFDIDFYSFVGTFLKRNNLIDAGLPRKDFFIYQDDLEHSVRMRKTGRIICCTGIKIEHSDNILPTNETSWRDYYANRNLVVMYKDHFSKWSLFWRMSRRFVVVLLSHSLSKVRIFKTAVKDGLNGRMGVHEIYKPGWKVNE